jgi:hypothetical protein
LTLRLFQGASFDRKWFRIGAAWSRRGSGGKPLDLRQISLEGRGGCGTAPSGMGPRVQAGAFQQGEEAEGLADAAQGDVKGMVIKGGIEEAVQTDFQEGQFIQEGGLAGLVVEVLLEVALAGEMLDVAAEGGGAEAELRGQGAVGHPMHKAEVDLGAGGVRADGTTFYHIYAPGKRFPHYAGYG